MDTQKLIHFHFVARYLSFSKAAEECHIAQTAMSRSIAALESELGFKLFNRTCHHVSLTPAGRSFLEDTEEIVRKLRSAKSRAYSISENFSEFLSIGFGSYERPFMMDHVKSFCAENHQTSITICHLSSDEMLDHLLSEKCDIVYGPVNRLACIKNASSIWLTTSKVKLAVNADNPLAKFEYITPDMLEGRTFVCPIGTGSLLLNQFRQRCAKIGFNPGKIVCTNNAEALFTAVELDIAVALVPDHLNPYQNTRMRLIEIKSPFSTFGEHIAVGFNNHGNATIERFLKHVKRCVDSQAHGCGV